MFPKGGEVQSIMFFDEIRNKLFMSFNYMLTSMSMKADNSDRIITHEKPVTAALYNWLYNQVWKDDQLKSAFRFSKFVSLYKKDPQSNKAKICINLRRTITFKM